MAGMWLKAITCFNLTQFPALSTEDLTAAVEAERFTPCSSMERERHGFTPVYEQESLVRKVGDVFWMQLKSEVKPIPGAIVKRMLAERIKEIEQRDARKVARKEKKELKEEIIDEMIATALPVESYVTVMVDPKAKLLVIGTASAKRAERVLVQMMRCIDNLGFSRMEFAKTIPGQMSNLLLDEESSEFVTDSSLVLQGPGSPAATVRFAKHSLAGAEIVNHLNAGLRPIELELGWQERLSFVLNERFEIKRLAFLDLVTSDFENAKPEDPGELIDAMLMIQNGELREMIVALTAWLGGPAEKAATA